MEEKEETKVLENSEKELKIKKIGAIAFAILIVAFLALGFLLNKKLLKAPIDDLQDDKIKFNQFISQVQTSYKNNVALKENFINLNGFFLRITGRNHYNNVTRLKNGMLTYGSLPEIDMQPFADGITEFDAYLKENGIDYIYVLAPIKCDLGNTLVYTGSVNFSNQNADKLLKGFGKDVSYIDLRPYLVSDPDLVKKYFYVTDHHWNTDGAFEAFKIFLSQLNEKYPDANIDMSLIDKDNWDVTTYEKCFLGSHGKRVGKYYAGIDDFLLYTPKFETQMSMYVPKYKAYYEGTFKESVFVKEEYVTNKNFFNETPYVAYIGGDYPIVHHRNPNASSDLKILILKDSFALPFQSFLSCAFKEIDVVDPRYFTECTLAEYVAISKPDLVITLMNPSVFNDTSYQKTGVAQGKYHSNQTTETVVVEKEKLEIKAAIKNSHANSVVLDKVPYNTKITISFDDVEFLAGNSEYITVALYDSTEQKFISNYAFDIDYYREKGKFEWTFLSPDSGSNNLQILIYAGGHGHTEGNHARFTNIQVIQYS